MLQKLQVAHVLRDGNAAWKGLLVDSDSIGAVGSFLHEVFSQIKSEVGQPNTVKFFFRFLCVRGRGCKIHPKFKKKKKNLLVLLKKKGNKIYEQFSLFMNTIFIRLQSAPSISLSFSLCVSCSCLSQNAKHITCPKKKKQHLSSIIQGEPNLYLTNAPLSCMLKLFSQRGTTPSAEQVLLCSSETTVKFNFFFIYLGGERGGDWCELLFLSPP